MSDAYGRAGALKDVQKGLRKALRLASDAHYLDIGSAVYDGAKEVAQIREARNALQLALDDVERELASLAAQPQEPGNE